MVTLSYEESAAIAYILAVVGYEAKGIADGTSNQWAKHADAINSLIADSVYADGCIDTLDEKEAAAVRFLLSTVGLESKMEACEIAGMARLREKLAGIAREK